MENAELLAAIVTSSIDPILSYDLTGKILSWNNAATLLFGYTTEEIIGKNVIAIIPENKPSEKELLIEKILWGETIKNFQTERVHKNGIPIPVSVSVSPIKNEEGKTIGISCILKKIERRKSEAKASALLESAPDAMVIVNKFGQIVLVNAQTEKLFGFSREELIGQEVEILMPERYRRSHSQHRGIFYSHPKTRDMGTGLELHGINKEGKEFPVEISLSPLQLEEGMFVSAAIRDITRRKKEEQKFRGLLESAPDAMVIVNKNGTIVFINSQTEKLFGFKRNEIIGEKVKILIPDQFRGNHPDHRMGFFLNPKFRSMGVGLELYGQKKDKSIFPVEISLSPIETEDGLLVASAIRDITEQKKARQELKTYAEKLELTNKELESFTFIASHDLKEPLRKVKIFSDLILSQDKGLLSETSINYLKKIEDSAERMQQLINDLLAFSVVTHLNEKFQLVDLNDVLKEVKLSIQDSLIEKKAFIHIEPLPKVSGIFFQLKQAFENILLNSLKYVAEDKIPEIRICCEKAPILSNEVSQSGSSFHQIIIKDNGIGFDQEQAPKVFDFFYRLHSKTEYPGTGIGLAIVKRIILNHNGSVFAESEVGKGTSVIIKLPVV